MAEEKQTSADYPLATSRVNNNNLFWSGDDRHWAVGQKYSSRVNSTLHKLKLFIVQQSITHTHQICLLHSFFLDFHLFLLLLPPLNAQNH